MGSVPSTSQPLIKLQNSQFPLLFAPVLRHQGHELRKFRSGERALAHLASILKGLSANCRSLEVVFVVVGFRLWFVALSGADSRIVLARNL